MFWLKLVLVLECWQNGTKPLLPFSLQSYAISKCGMVGFCSIERYGLLLSLQYVFNYGTKCKLTIRLP